jgi:hypothetical protein
MRAISRSLPALPEAMTIFSMGFLLVFYPRIPEGHKVREETRS